MQSALSIIFGYGFLIVGLLLFGTAVVQAINFQWMTALTCLVIGFVFVPAGVYLTGTYGRWKFAKDAQLHAQELARKRAEKAHKDQ